MKKLNQRFFAATFFVLVILGLSDGFLSEGWAQQASKTVSDSLQIQIEMNLENKQKDVKIMLEKIEISGRIEKPQTVFIVQGMDPTAGGIQIDRSFFKQIFRQVDKDDLRKRIEMSRRKQSLNK